MASNMTPNMGYSERPQMQRSVAGMPRPVPPGSLPQQPVRQLAPHASAVPRTSASTPMEKQDIYIQTTFKQNVTKAREILTDLMKKAAIQLQEQINQPGGQRESHRLRLEKSIEELFSVLDQVENNLKLGLLWYGQHFESKRNVGIPVASKRSEETNHQATIPLPNYQKVVKLQIAAAQELHDLITDAENRLSQASVPPTPTTGAPNNMPSHPEFPMKS